jgi:hypothetical protein
MIEPDQLLPTTFFAELLFTIHLALGAGCALFIDPRPQPGGFGRRG